MGKEAGVEISLEAICARIRAAGSKKRQDGLSVLKIISDSVRPNIYRLGAEDLTRLGAEFSSACKTLGEKPDWARQVCVLIDRRIMAIGLAKTRTNEAATLSHAEFTPHPRSSDALVSKMAFPGEGGDTRVRHYLAG